MCEQGAEPRPEDDLIWIITAKDYVKPDGSGVSSNKYSGNPFSAFLERRFGPEAAISFAADHFAEGKWPAERYGIVRIKYDCVVKAGFKGVFALEHGIKAHLNLFPDPESDLSKKGKKRAMVDCSKIIIPWDKMTSDGEQG